MSNRLFPVLPGLTWSVKKHPTFTTPIQESMSRKEVRFMRQSSPIWQLELVFDYLRDYDSGDGMGGYSELDTLMGFFLSSGGMFDSFLFEDIYSPDNSVADQQIGTGDNVTLKFQLTRNIGGFNETIQNINGAPTIYLDGTAQVGGYTVSSLGLITFAVAPTVGQIVTADFNFYYRVRFDQDDIEFENFMDRLWTAQSVKLVTVIL